jgi:chain length determinant protein (polysaccharide antigen chain regulator)
MQQSDQEIYPYQTDEIDLRASFNSLVARKFLIAGLTGFVTVLAILYALNLAPTYQVTSTFTSPNEGSIISINKLGMTEETKNSVFSSFLTRLSSKDLQRELFVEGDYVTKFNADNAPIDDFDNFITDTINSVKVQPPNLNKKDMDLGLLTELPYSVSMQGNSPEAISAYLNSLVALANSKTINALIKLNELKISNRLQEVSLDRKLLILKAEAERLNDIEKLNEAVVIARSLGIIENNFKLIKGDGASSDLTNAIGESKDLPDWYLYGEKALLQRVDLLQNRTSDEPFILELGALDIEKIKLESSVVAMNGVSAMQISQVAIIPKNPIKPNKRLIVLLAFIGSFMMSILLALIMGALKPDEKTTA